MKGRREKKMVKGGGEKIEEGIGGSEYRSEEGKEKMRKGRWRKATRG